MKNSCCLLFTVWEKWDTIFFLFFPACVRAVPCVCPHTILRLAGSDFCCFDESCASPNGEKFKLTPVSTSIHPSIYLCIHLSLQYDFTFCVFTPRPHHTDFFFFQTSRKKKKSARQNSAWSVFTSLPCLSAGDRLCLYAVPVGLYDPGAPTQPSSSLPTSSTAC